MLERTGVMYSYRLKEKRRADSNCEMQQDKRRLIVRVTEDQAFSIDFTVNREM
jgi:hypothetical protein